MYKIDEMYNDFLSKRNIVHKESRLAQSQGRYSASSSGMCIKKQWFQKQGYEPAIPDNSSLRIFRLGTMVGEDLEEAVKFWAMRNPTLNVYTEEYIKDDSLNLGGSFDLLIVDEERKGYLYDYKTCNMGSWSAKFSPKPWSIQSNNYDFQLGTYAMMLNDSQKFCDEIVYMGLFYYNKNTSKTRLKDSDLMYIDLAREYWEKINATAPNPDPPPYSEEGLVPYYKWECGKYCSFVDQCDSPLIK